MRQIAIIAALLSIGSAATARAQYDFDDFLRAVESGQRQNESRQSSQFAQLNAPAQSSVSAGSLAGSTLLESAPAGRFDGPMIESDHAARSRNVPSLTSLPLEPRDDDQTLPPPAAKKSATSNESPLPRVPYAEDAAPSASDNGIGAGVPSPQPFYESPVPAESPAPPQAPNVQAYPAPGVADSPVGIPQPTPYPSDGYEGQPFASSGASCGDCRGTAVAHGYGVATGTSSSLRGYFVASPCIAGLWDGYVCTATAECNKTQKAIGSSPMRSGTSCSSGRCSP